ncbi:MAG: helix-turn-helix domain-containing protein [Firmicutes bacterium]|nr:helix-turn-helix domain-containing protein [Bacillota bacterium]
MVKDTFEKLCAKKGVSPSSVCQYIGISSAAYSQWKADTIPRNTTLKKMADYFDVSVDYLLGKEERNPELSKQEQYLLDCFRELNEKGKEYILQTMDMVKKEYKKSDTPTVMENIS